MILARLFALLTALHVPATDSDAVRDQCGAAEAAEHRELAKVARDYPECVDELGTDGLSGLDATELRDHCEAW